MKFIIYLFLVFSLSSLAQQTDNLVNDFLFLKDYQKTKTIHSIEESDFKPITENILGLNDAPFWFKVSINKPKDSILVFDVKENSVATINIYQNKKLLATTSESIGLTHPILRVKTTSTAPFFLKVDFSRQVYFPLKVYNNQYFLKHNTFTFFKNGFYYGFVVIVFIVNIFFFVSLQDNSFLFYCFFLAAINLGISDYDGFSKLWIPDEFAKISNVFFHFLIPLTGALFATVFLELKEYKPKSLYVGGILLLFPLIAYTIYLTTNNYLSYALGDTLCLAVLLYYWLQGVLVLKSQQYAKFFVIGYSLVLFTALFFVIPQDFGFNQFSVSIEHVKFGALFEMLILTYAITYRVKILKEENNQLTESIKKQVTTIFNLQEQLKVSANQNQLNSVEDKIANIAESYSLSDRETDILLQMINGLNNNEIAEKLFISTNTVKYHLKNLYVKLDVSKRSDISAKLIFDK